MPAQYAPLPNDNPRSRLEDADDELEAAFEASDDEDDANAESRPLNPQNTSAEGHDDDDDGRAHDTAQPDLHPLSSSPPQFVPAHSRRQSTAAPGTYDFEAVDYDFPPPGSPPRRDRALPNNDWGNTNGQIPTSPAARPRPNRGAHRPAFEWTRRILPARIADGLIGRSEDRRRVVGGGIGNDGVFANVTAKPSLPRPIREEDGVYVMPEESQKDAPPSYAAAQADAVPPYWETTVHAPSSLSPGMMLPGELPIDGLATGTLFSFAWNMLVSISFQFVGFLLTYLLHTTHAAKLGARAGLGLTLVQYGFALRTGKDDESMGGTGEGDMWGGWGNADGPAPPPTPTFATAAAAEEWAAAHNGTVPGVDSTSTTLAADWTTEWLSFVLMTIGWFILLNSLLSFWRIKRWEKSILASHQENPDRPPPLPVTTPTNSQGRGHGRQSSFALHFERTLGLRLPTAQMLRQGLGLSSWGDSSPRSESRGGSAYVFDEAQEDLELAMERGSVEAGNGEGEEELLLDIPADHPDRARLIAEAYANERRLQEDLRAAGLL